MDALTCKQVDSMISLYIDEKLTDEHKALLERHFAQCPFCYQKYLNMKNIIENLKVSYEKIVKDVETVETANLFNIRDYEKFYNNVSAYVDNELDYEESIDFRKYLLKSKSARNDLKNMYIMQNHIKDSFTQCILNCEANLSKKVISELKKEQQVNKPYMKVAILFGLVLLTASGLYIFTHPQKNTPPVIKKHRKTVYAKTIDQETNPKNLISYFLY